MLPSRCIHYGGLLCLLALLSLFFVPTEPVALGQQPERSKQISELQKQIADLNKKLTALHKLGPAPKSSSSRTP